MNRNLANVAAEATKQNFHGDTPAAISNLQPLLNLFDVADDVTLEALNEDWSGAFAFLCTQLAGLGLPIRYPDPRVERSFAFVSAWEQYARLPKIDVWRTYDESPEPGDILFFDETEGKAPMMGIVTAVRGDVMELAVGNYHNHSALIERPISASFRGLIRCSE